MLKSNLKKFFMVVVTTLSLTIVANPVIDTINNQPTQTVAKAEADDTNAIWTFADDGRIQIQPIDQNNNIYYSITTPKSNLYYLAWQLAAQKWNNLGVIHLVQVPVGDSRSQITLGGSYHYMPAKKLKQYLTAHHISKDFDGNTESQYHNASVDNHPNYTYLANVSAKLLPPSWDESSLNILKVAEHELGHCLGFAHDSARINGRKLVMNAETDASSAPLGNTERQLLLKYYGPFLNNNN